MAVVAVAIVCSLTAAIMHDSMPAIALRMARMAGALTPRPLRKDVDPYADIYAAVQAIPTGEETRFSVTRMALGALFVAVPRLIVFYVAVAIQVAIVLRQAGTELKQAHTVNGQPKNAEPRQSPTRRPNAGHGDNPPPARQPQLDDTTASTPTDAAAPTPAEYAEETSGAWAQGALQAQHTPDPAFKETAFVQSVKKLRDGLAFNRRRPWYVFDAHIITARATFEQQPSEPKDDDQPNPDEPQRDS
jgi:hypothetical protein